MELVQYTPPRTVRLFISDYRPGELFYDWIVGPLGSGKTTGLFFKLVYMAKLQARGHDGIRRTRAVIVRSTVPQLKDTTIKSWNAWFRDGVAGTWQLTERNFTLRFDDVECEIMFRPLDTDEDIARVLSLEVTFAIIDEFIDIPKAIIDALSGRCGRYPAKKDGGATNWGMWGSSNPGTEDNWWYDYLHNNNEANVEVCEHIKMFGPSQRVLAAVAKLKAPPASGANVRYFQQPPGDTDEAENIENLPGGMGYYTNQMIGKSAAWIEQFVRANWGFSASETPVVKTYNPAIHISKSPLIYSPHYELVGGFDPGITGMAMVIGQEDLYGRLCVLGELVAVGYGVTRFISEKLKPYMRVNFPNGTLIIAPDPASANKQQNDERAVVDVLKKSYQVKIETNNRLAKRIDAIESYTTRLTEVGPALLIDKDRCPRFARALAGGWRYRKMTRGDQMEPSPEKNEHSHVGDAGGYLARYFHRQYEKTGKRGLTVFDKDGPPIIQQRPNSYHIR